MVEGKTISIGNVAYVVGICSKKLFRWYKILSGYNEALNKGEIGKDNITIKEKGESKEIKVPISKPENIGEFMAVDEKTINGECYSVLLNRQTNKIALMANTLKTSHLLKLLEGFNDKMNVKSLTRDMAINYDWLGRQAFMKAYHVVDKFHVIKLALDNLQSVRIRYRQAEITKRREASDKGEKYEEKEFENGDTTLQLLARSRGLLYKQKHQWTEHQKQRAAILFKEYKDIKESYDHVSKLRRWYRPTKGKKIYKKTKDKKREELETLIEKIKESEIYEMKNLSYSLQTHLAQITNYFIAKETNAKAEALNNNMQRFININYGARNSEFFFFRLKRYFS